MAKHKIECPYCKHIIQKHVKRCPFCGKYVHRHYYRLAELKRNFEIVTVVDRINKARKALEEKYGLSRQRIYQIYRREKKYAEE